MLGGVEGGVMGALLPSEVARDTHTRVGRGSGFGARSAPISPPNRAGPSGQPAPARVATERNAGWKPTVTPLDRVLPGGDAGGGPMASPIVSTTGAWSEQAPPVVATTGGDRDKAGGVSGDRAHTESTALSPARARRLKLREVRCDGSMLLREKRYVVSFAMAPRGCGGELSCCCTRQARRLRWGRCP